MNTARLFWNPRLAPVGFAVGTAFGLLRKDKIEANVYMVRGKNPSEKQVRKYILGYYGLPFAIFAAVPGPSCALITGLTIGDYLAVKQG